MSIRQGNRVVSGNNAVLKANKSLDNITTKAEEKIVNSVINTVGANEKGLIVNSSMFDMKITDRILSGSELAGWAIAGSTVYKSEYPDFYNACLREYEGGFADIIHGDVIVDTSSLTENKGVVSGFATSKYIESATKVNLGNNFEINTKALCTGESEDLQCVICGKTNQYITIQWAAGKTSITYGVGNGTAWISTPGGQHNVYYNKWYWFRITFDGEVYRFYFSLDGETYILDATIESTVIIPEFTPCLGIDRHLSGPFVGEIDLKETYIKSNNEVIWSATATIPSKSTTNSHTYYDASVQSDIEKSYNMYGSADYYGINTEHECIILPRPLEEENRFTYYCVGNTEVGSASIDISKEVELNNPFFLGMSKYFENTPTNASWLASNGEFQSSAVYPAMYNYVLENVTAGTKDFASISDTYDDYCFVLDEANQSFRLPLLNGEESIPSNRGVDLKGQMVKDTTIPFIAPGNGQYTFGVYATATGQNMNIHNVSSDRGMSIQSGKSSGLIKVNLEAKRGDEVNLTYALGGEINNGIFRYNKGNGTLYYYVGEAVNNANLIDTAKITTALANKVSKGSDEFDGDWIYSPKSIFSGVSFTTLNTNYTYDISEHLPKDDYEYEVQIYVYGNTAASSGKTTYLWCGTDVTGGTYNPIVRAITRTSSTMAFTGTAILRVGVGRTFTIQNNGTSCGSCSGSLLCYRRLGRKN